MNSTTPNPPCLFPRPLWPALLFTASCHAAVMEGEIRNGSGQPVGDAVVAAMPIQDAQTAASNPPFSAIMDQRNREFAPHVLAVRRGAEVNFPNHDKIRHHVYSFSPAKRFEIKLYKDIPPNPIRFDTPGVAVLGCNIHDWMISYIYVSDTPYFTKTDAAGRWSLQAPAGAYKVRVWHADMTADQSANEDTLTPTAQQAAVLNKTLNLRENPRTGKPPASLQEEVYLGEP